MLRLLQKVSIMLLIILDRRKWILVAIFIWKFSMSNPISDRNVVVENTLVNLFEVKFLSLTKCILVPLVAWSIVWHCATMVLIGKGVAWMAHQLAILSVNCMEIQDPWVFGRRAVPKTGRCVSIPLWVLCPPLLEAFNPWGTWFLLLFESKELRT
jgi:hypothetical protein